MGYTAELVAEKYKVSREEMDKLSFQSYQKAIDSEAKGAFAQERMKLSIPQRKGADLLFSEDEGVRQTSLEKLSRLRSAFKKEGTVTAGNASQISDGAAAVAITTKQYAEQHQLPILATIHAQASAGVDLHDVLVAPIYAIPKVLKKAKLSLNDIDLFEVNEAFASSSVAVLKTLEIPEKKVNVHGGSIALGHPIGASGARVLVTLIYALKQHQKRYGLATLCLGGGEAVAFIIENSNNK